MTRSKYMAAWIVAASLTAVTPALAQGQTDPMRGAMPMQGMSGAQGGQGMTMPGGSMGMMNMMSMMGQGGMAMPDMGVHGMGQRGMAMIDRVEGRIAFLRTELKITDAQAKVWNDFAQSLRDNAKRLAAVRDAVAKSAGTSTPTIVQRLETQERWLTARLEGTRAIKLTADHLYAALSPDQKKSADDLLGMHMGLMPSGMMAMGMMSGGGMMMPMGGNVR